MLIEARNEADTVSVHAGRALKQGADLVPAEERAAIEAAVAALRRRAGVTIASASTRRPRRQPRHRAPGRGADGRRAQGALGRAARPDPRERT